MTHDPNVRNGWKSDIPLSLRGPGTSESCCIVTAAFYRTGPRPLMGSPSGRIYFSRQRVAVDAKLVEQV